MRRTILCSQITASHNALERAMDDKATLNLVDDFTLKSSPPARQKALSRLKQAFATAHFEWATNSKPPLACWSYFKLRNAEDWAHEDDPPRDKQKCITTNFLVAGRMPNGSRLMTGRWSLEWSFHALARLVSPERSPLGATPLQTLHLAHKTLLKSSADAIFTYKDKFLLPLADGALLCNALPATVDGYDTVFVVCHTWLADWMGFSNYSRIPPARDHHDALGAFHLMPPPLRLVDAGDTVHVPAAAIAAFGQAFA
jgi:hypothetical protein